MTPFGRAGRDITFAEASLGLQIEPQANVGRLGLLAASNQDRRDNRVVFVHQRGPNQVGGEFSSPLPPRGRAQGTMSVIGMSEQLSDRRILG